MEHTLEFILSGSWKRELTVKDGDYEKGDPYDLNREMTVSAECSCGKRFLDRGEAWSHIEEVIEEQKG